MTSGASSNLKVIIGQNIKAAREARSMTQRDLAGLLDTDTMLVSKWERGKHSPSDTNLQALSQALGCDVAWFFTDRTNGVAA